MTGILGIIVWAFCVFIAMIVYGILRVASEDQAPQLPARKARTSDTSQYEVVKVDLGKGKVKT